MSLGETVGGESLREGWERFGDEGSESLEKERMSFASSGGRRKEGGDGRRAHFDRHIFSRPTSSARGDDDVSLGREETRKGQSSEEETSWKGKEGELSSTISFARQGRDLPLRSQPIL